MVRIEIATAEDIPTIQTIAEKTWWPTYSSILSAEQIRYMLDAIYSTEVLQNVMRTSSQTFLVLVENEMPVGFSSHSVRPEDPEVVKIHKIYVLPEKQGHGYGKMLISEIHHQARQQGARFLDLNVNRFNPARTFYERLGFEILREEDIPIGPYWMNDFVMRIGL